MKNVAIIVVLVGFGVIEWVNVVFGFIAIVVVVVVVVVVVNVFVVIVFVTASIIPPFSSQSILSLAVFSFSTQHTFTAPIFLSPTITIN